jgi:hypothetical protein
MKNGVDHNKVFSLIEFKNYTKRKGSNYSLAIAAGFFGEGFWIACNQFKLLFNNVKKSIAKAITLFFIPNC